LSGPQLQPALENLRSARGIRRISAIGGRSTAPALLDTGLGPDVCMTTSAALIGEVLVQDFCLTTPAWSAGTPGPPLYVGRQPPQLEPIVRKRGTDPNHPIVFEHLTGPQHAGSRGGAGTR